ncbi:hypothetical protein ACLESD_50315, partial [Pyxidicoccus sp. 3LFB2]
MPPRIQQPSRPATAASTSTPGSKEPRAKEPQAPAKATAAPPRPPVKDFFDDVRKTRNAEVQRHVPAAP